MSDIYWQLYERNRRVDELYVVGFRIWGAEDLYEAQQSAKLKDCSWIYFETYKG